MDKEFRKVNKALDTYSPQECEPAVKKRMSECRLRLEAAQFEAEKVVTQAPLGSRGLGPCIQRGQTTWEADECKSESR
jgi:hypothetical protein